MKKEELVSVGAVHMGQRGLVETRVTSKNKEHIERHKILINQRFKNNKNNNYRELEKTFSHLKSAHFDPC